jgi:hypothetical protein
MLTGHFVLYGAPQLGILILKYGHDIGSVLRVQYLVFERRSMGIGGRVISAPRDRFDFLIVIVERGTKRYPARSDAGILGDADCLSILSPLMLPPVLQ